MGFDVIVLYHPKDKETLHWCVSGIRNYIDAARILGVCNRKYRSDVEHVGAIFIDEESIIEGLTIESYSNWRWYWYFQQILKFGITDKIDTDYYLAVDADVVFLRKVSFFNAEGKPLYTTATEYHKPYFDVFHQLFGFHAHREYSFTVHHMMYNRHIVKEMRDNFQDQKPWYMNIVRYVEPRAPWFCASQFNELEIYGHYIKALHPDEVNIRPLRYKHLSVLPTAELIKQLAWEYDYCGSHHWARGDDTPGKPE